MATSLGDRHRVLLSPEIPRQTPLVCFSSYFRYPKNGSWRLTFTDLILDIYTWTRDTALAVMSLIHEFLAGNSSLELLIQQYITT